MRDILYHEVRQITGLGIKVYSNNPRVRLFKPGDSGDTTQGGWVTPGRYILAFDRDHLHDVSGSLSEERINDAASKGEALLYKVIRQQYGDLPFTNDNFTIPAGWDYEVGELAASTFTVSAEEDDIYGTSFDPSGGELVENDNTRDSNVSLEGGVLVDLSAGQTLVVGLGTPSGTLANPRGTEGFTIHCAESPVHRALPYGQGDGTYVSSVWTNFKDKMTEELSALPYDNSLTFSTSTLDTIYFVREDLEHCFGDPDRGTSGIDCSSYTLTRRSGSGIDFVEYATDSVRGFKSDSRMGPGLGHDQFEYIVDILYNTAIKYWQVKDTSGAYSLNEQQSIWRTFKFACYNSQYGSGDWCEGITTKRHMAHGTNKASVKRHLSAMKLFFVAAVLDEAGAFGNYKPSFEGLYKMATVAQTMKASFPSVVSYGRFNNGVSGIATAGTSTATWLSGIVLNASGPTGLPFEDMYCDGEFRQAGMAIKLWFAKLLGLELPAEVNQFLYLPQNGTAVVRPWGLTNSRYGHISNPSGVGSSWSDEHNAYTAQAMQWLWLTGEYDHTPMMQWFTRNAHFYDPAFIGQHTGNASSLPGAYHIVTDSEVIEEPYNLQSTVHPAGSSISLVWQNGFEVGKTYEVYQINDAQVGGALSALGSEVNAGTLAYDEQYGVVSGNYRLVYTGAVALATIPTSGDGDYYFVVRAVKGPNKSRNSVVKKVTVAGSQQWDGSSVTDSRSGISWDISGTATVGVYVDGSPWVLGPATITGTDANGGSVLDLSVGEPQPFDPNADNYGSGVDVVWPVTLSGDNSIITTASGIGGVSAMAILTVVSSVPDVSSFRPAPYAGSVDTGLNASDVTTSTFASSVDSSGSMFLDPNSTRVETYSYRLDDVWYYGDSDVSGGGVRRPRPAQMPDDDADASLVFHEAALLLHSSDSDKDLLAIPMTQQCIDMVGSIESAAANGNRPNAVAARSAGVLLKRLTDASGSYLDPVSGTILDGRVYVLNTVDDRYAADGSGTIILGISASGVRNDYGDTIGWTEDNTTSTFVLDNIDYDTAVRDAESSELAIPFDRNASIARLAGDNRWVAAEAMSVLLFDDGIGSYGNRAIIYYAHQNAKRPERFGNTVIGQLDSPFLRETFSSLEGTLFTSSIRGDDVDLVSNYDRPSRDMLPSVQADLPRLGITGNVIVSSGTYSNFATNETVHIRAHDVTIRGAHINVASRSLHCIECPDEFSGLTVDSCLLAGSNKAAIRGNDMVVKDSIISNISANGINVGQNSTVSGCYFEKIAHVGAGNYYGIVVNGGSNINILQNYVNTPYDANGSKVINAIRIRPRASNVVGVNVTDNWFRGGTGPGLRVGAFPSSGFTLSGVSVTNNRFSLESGTTEAWSVAAPVAGQVTFSGNQWWNPATNNVVREEIEEPDYSAPGGPSNP